jgi:Zn-finger nucleic acid-binding protein
MLCPKCSTPLTEKYYKGMLPVDYCPLCRGMWLDFDELDRLEDAAFDQDALKGSLLHRETDSLRVCPSCGGELREFQYRLYDLKLDWCPARHGFWLDAGEEERVQALMLRRAGEVRRKQAAEGEWQNLLKGLHQFLKQRP